jgi:hypothetical protein
LKRIPTLVGKLGRERGNVTQMHDVGGVRAVLPGLREVYVVRRRLLKSWTIVKEHRTSQARRLSSSPSNRCAKGGRYRGSTSNRHPGHLGEYGGELWTTVWSGPQVRRGRGCSTGALS